MTRFFTIFCIFSVLTVTSLSAQVEELPFDDFISDLEETVETPENSENTDVEIAPLEEAAPQRLVVEPPQTETELAEPSVQTQIVAPEQTVQEEPQSVAIPHSGLFYDADSIGPNPLKQNSVPREVDPKFEPGSRFVVVQRSAGPGSVQAQIVAGKRAIDLGRYGSALEIFENLYKKVPDSRDVLLGLAIAQQNNGFTETAIATYEELLEKDPNHIEANVNMLGLLKMRTPNVAFRRLKELWDKNPESSSIAAQLGLTSAAMGNIPEAIRYLGVAASLEPHNASHFYNMAVLSDRAGASREAINFYQKALEVDVTHAGGRSIPRDDIYDRLAFLRRL